MLYPYTVVYLLIPTSNHNTANRKEKIGAVVYLLIPTSNHNQICIQKWQMQLYIF